MRFSRILTLVVVVTCSTAATAAAQRNNKVTCGADVPLNVAISDVRSHSNGSVDNTAYRSDGGGMYSNGIGRVEARFQVENCTHDFTMNLNMTTRSMTAVLDIDDVATDFPSHFFNFDRIHSVPLTVPNSTFPNAFADWCTSGVVTNADGSIRKNPDGSYQDRYAPCGNDDPAGLNGPQYNFVRRIAVLSLDGDERLTFRGTIINTPMIPREACQVFAPDAVEYEQLCETDFVRVYHPDANTWVIKSDNAGRGAHHAWGGGKVGYVFQEHQNVPLEITITKK